MKSLPILIIAPLLLACADPGPSAVDTGTSSGGTEGLSTTEPVEASSSESIAESSTDGTSSETTEPEPSTSTGAVQSTCGDGLIDSDEACDDGNDEDADGCNRDCTASGSVLWTFDFPSGTQPEHIAVDGLDQLHVFGLYEEVELLHVVFSSDGELLTQDVIDVPFDAPAGTTERERNVDGFGLSPEGAPIYSITDVYFGEEGYIDADFQVRAEDPAWSYAWDTEDGFSFYFDVIEDGRTFGIGRDFYAFSPEGSVLSTGPETSARLVAADALGVALLGRDLTFYTPDGEVAWSVGWPSGNLSGATALARFPGGDVVAIGQAGEDILRASQIRIARYTPEGVEASTWTWPDRPAADIGPGYDAFVVTPNTHIVFAGLGTDGPFLWSLDEDYGTRWKVEYPFGFASVHLESDSVGALLYLSGRTVGKLAQ